MKKQFDYITGLKKIAFIFFVFTPISSLFAACSAPTFSSSFPSGGYHGYTPSTLPATIQQHLGDNWCSSDNLCPVGVVKSNGGCNNVSPALKSKWQSAVGADATNAFFESADSYYYSWKLCSICLAANGTSDGSGTNTTTETPAEDGSQPTPAVPGSPTSVAISGFDKLDNPLGPANLTTVSDVIERALGIIIKVSIPFVVLMLIWTGFQFVIAQGNSSKITAAKNTLLWVIVGAAILIGCVAIAKAIANSVETVAKVASGQ